MANFFTRALDKVTPWRRGGEVQRDQEAYAKKKKREEEQAQQAQRQSQSPTGIQVRQTPGIPVNQPQIQRPENLFQGLNQNLQLPGAPKNNILVNPNPSLAPVVKPQPGTVVQPSTQNQPDKGMQQAEGITGTRGTKNGEKGVYTESKFTPGKMNFIPDAPKKQDNRFWQKVGRGLTTAKDTAVGTVANVPEVALAGARTATGIVQGVTQLPHMVTATAATGTQQLQKHMNNPVTRQVNRGFQDVNTGVKTVTKQVDRPLNYVNRGLDIAAKKYEEKVPAAANGEKIYKYEQIPLNVLAALLTLGGSTAAEAGNAGKAGQSENIISKITGLLNKPLTSNSENVIAKTSQAISGRATPVVEALNKPFGTAKAGANKLINSRRVPTLEREIVDAGEAGNVMNGVEDLTRPPTQIQVQQPTPIEINAPPSEGVNIPVTNNNPTGRPIIEIGGDRPGAVRVPTPDEAAAQRAATQFENQPVGRPDPNIEGVTPREPTKPFSLNPETAAANQKKVVEEYATMLKDMGEGNGTQLIPDGEGGYTRTSNNVRDAANKGKRMTKQDWIDQAESDLRNGKAEPGHQQAFNDAGDPEVQAMLDRGEQAPVGEGRPITVKQATGIPVTDMTDVPTGLPENPGTVRATKATAPNNAKSAAVAAENPSMPVVTVRNYDTGELSYYKPKSQSELDSLVKKIDGDRITSDGIAGMPDSNGNVVHVTAGGTEKLERAGYKEVSSIPDERFAGENAAAANGVPDNLPRPGETDEVFLKRVAGEIQSNVKRAVESLKATKKMTKAERANRAAAGQTAYEEAKAAGKSVNEQEAARKAAYSGKFDRQDYAGTPVHSADEQKLRDMIDEHYKDMPYQAGNVREAFGKLFHSGEPGYYSEGGNHIIPSDIKNIRKFLNESVPNPDGNGGLGDFAESAVKELAEQENGAGKIANAIGLQRALRFTADVSATGRQALPGALSHPIEFARAAKKSFEVMFSHKNYQKFVSELANNKEANYINDRLGAYLSVLNDDISKADDIYRNSDWAKKIPGVKQVVAASERQYNALLSGMRYASGKRFIDQAGGIAQLEKIASETGDPDAFLKAIGTVSNINTGRGSLGKLGANDSKILSNVLVSPRGLAARIQRFNPKYYSDLMKANPAAGKEALRSLGIQTALTVSALGAANAAGIYEDGQIKVGNTRYDITGGAANMVRTAVRVAQYVHGDRETSPFNNAETEVTRWMRNQLAPFVASSLDAIGIHQDAKSGTWINRWGEDVTLGSTVLDNFAPVNASQLASDKSMGTPGGQTAANTALGAFGVGVNTFESSEDKSLPKDKSLRDIYKQFEKEGIGTSTTDVNDYIAGGDYDKAARVADYNLKALQADPEAGAGAIKKAENTLQEIQLRKDGVPMTDDGITAKVEDGDWDSAIKGYQWKIEKAKADGELSKKTESGIKNDITRAEVARDNNIDPTLLSSYKSISEADWRKMGIPPGDKNYDEDLYDPEMYQALYDIDQRMSKKGVSYNSKALDKPKYSVKEAGSGSGGGSRQLDTSFGTLKEGLFAPRVQQYDTIDTKASNVPYIGVVRPNIVHKISSSG